MRPSLLDLFIVCSQSELKRFRHFSDRKYFAKPVLVEPLYSRLSDRLLVVRDPVRGHEYPVVKKSLINGYNLTKRQRLAAGF